MLTDTSKFNRVLALASAAPVAVALFSLLLGLGVPGVTEWFWPAPTTNSAEAAALGDGARVRALAAQGARLDAPLPVRRGFLDGDVPPTMSALEAAIRRRSLSLVQVFMELGVQPPADEARRLYCLAVEIDADDVAQLLQKAFALPVSSCTGPTRDAA